MRSMVEGAFTSDVSAIAPSTAFGGPPPPLRGGGADLGANGEDGCGRASR
jgi:hypothetical protein